MALVWFVVVGEFVCVKGYALVCFEVFLLFFFFFFLPLPTWIRESFWFGSRLL